MENHYANRIADALERIADALENGDVGSITLNGDLVLTVGGDGSLDAGFTPTEPDEAPDTIEALDLEYGQVVTFTYQGEQDDYPRQRSVRVDESYYQPSFAGGVTYISGWDLSLSDDYEDADAYRRFRDDRIKSPIILVEQEAADA